MLVFKCTDHCAFLLNSYLQTTTLPTPIIQVTAVLNIMFNLMVLVLSDITFSEGSALWGSIILSGNGRAFGRH